MRRTALRLLAPAYALISLCLAAALLGTGCAAPAAPPRATVTVTPLTITAMSTIDTVTVLATTTASPVTSVQTSTVQHTPPPVQVTSTMRQTVTRTPAPITFRYSTIIEQRVEVPTTVTVTATPLSPGAAFGGGRQVVGEQVQPGAYRAAGGARCTWTRYGGAHGHTSDIVAQGLGVSNPIVQIDASDSAFNSTGCGDWTAIG